MALKIIDARQSGFPHDGSFGRVHLVFDRELDAAWLKLSLFKLLGQDFLGKSSPPKASWGPRAHFFTAKLIARGNGQSVYRLGPEVTTFILPETVLEVASEDNSIRERAVWSEISVDFTWSGETGGDVDAPVTTIASPQSVVEQPKGEQPPVDPPKVETPEPLELVTGGLTTTTTLLPPKEPATPPPPVNWLLRILIAAAIVLMAGAAYAAYWTSQHRDLVCEQHGWFCDPELVAFRSAQSCAASKTCGAGTCVASYRNTYPNGRFRAQVDEIAVSKGMPCPEPPRDDPEKRAYERVTTCAASKTCGASTCVTEYRQLFPNGAHKADVDQIMATKGIDCIDSTEKEVYDQAVGCARPRTCGALECVAEYRRRYPAGRYKAQIDQIAVAQNARACADPVEEDVFERAASCARPKSCGADECLGEYRRRYPNGRHKADIDQIAQSPKAQACPDLDKEAFERADRCAAQLRCGADHCLIEYKRDFANGNYRAQIDRIAAQKGPACVVQPSPTPTSTASPSPDLPPLVPRRASDDPEFNCSRANLEPIEQMICKDGEMARANGELQRTFNNAVKPLRGTPNERPFRDRESDWVRERNQQCNIPESGSWNDMDLRRLKTCFLDKTRARINDLLR
jgi:uncharacterized protein YecT (DUF1311 family)